MIMKKIFKYTLTILAIVGLAAACQKEVEDVYKPAEPDASNCYGVYFPIQEAAGDHVVDPTAETKVIITVSREKSEGALNDVPYTVTATSDGAAIADPSTIFELGKINFADGQSETTLEINYPKTEVGVAYSCVIAIEKGQYASTYSANATQLTFGVTRVKWNNLGKVRVREDMLASTSLSGYIDPVHKVLEADILERDDMPGMFRVKGLYSPENLLSWLKPDFREYIDGADAELFFVVDATNPKKVWIQYTSVGWQFFSNGVFFIGSLVDANEAYCPTISSKKYASYVSDANYGTLENNVITFPAKGLCYGFAADDWWNVANNDGMTYFALPERKDASGKLIPAGVPVDYSVKLEVGLTEEGVVPVAVTAGLDIASIKYAVYDGELNAAQAANRAIAIADGSDISDVYDGLKPNAGATAKVGAFGVEAEETGIYTLVAVGCDADGKAQQDAYIVFTYVSAEDPVPVVISCGLEVTGKYAPKGYTTENSLEFYIFGEDITDAKIGVFKSMDLKTKGAAAIVSSLMAAKSLPDEAIDAINDGGYVDVAAGLSPGTEYFLAVWATNGFEEDIFMSEYATTEGDPLPIYMDYTTADFYADGRFANAEAAFGTWNYYGVDAYGSLGVREYLGPVTISASETPAEGPDDSGLYDEYVYVTGLFGDLSWLANYGFPTDATVEMDVYNGIIYIFNLKTVEGAYDVRMGAKAVNSWNYTLEYASAFIPVLEGYYAYVDVSQYAASYNFCGIGLSEAEAGWIAKIWDPLLVDPKLDNNGVIPAGVSAAASNAKSLIQEIAARHENLVETEKGRIQSIIDEYKNAARNLFAPAGIEGAERTPKQVSVKVVPMAPVATQSTQPTGAPGYLPQVAR